MRHKQLRPMVVKPWPLVLDRPGWIPPHITENWDPDPYAYQTEEEMMPAGGLHGELLIKLTKVLDDELQKRGLMLLMDTFMLYRDQLGTKRRIAPDLQIISRQSPTPKSYDLDQKPPPYCVVEVVSPDSKDKDFNKNVELYVDYLQIPTYLVIDVIMLQDKPHLTLDLWRLQGGKAVKILPDAEGKYFLPEMGLNIVTQGQRFVFTDAYTGEEIFDVKQLNAALAEERYLRQQAEARAEAEAEARRAAEARAKFEAEMRRAAEANALAIEAKANAEAQIRRALEAKANAEAEARKAVEVRANAEAEARKAVEARVKAVEARADAEADARRDAEAKAKAEAEARRAVEEELARLRAQLARRG